jgi:hypothetical protein
MKLMMLKFLCGLWSDTNSFLIVDELERIWKEVGMSSLGTNPTFVKGGLSQDGFVLTDIWTKHPPNASAQHYC